MEEEIIPLVTNWNGSRCTRSSCDTIIKPGDQYKLIHPKDPDGNTLGTQMVCMSCFQHYLNKAGTARRVVSRPPVNNPPQPQFLSNPLSPERLESIRQQTASVQRTTYNGGKSPIQAIGLQFQNPYAGAPPVFVNANQPVYAASGMAFQSMHQYPGVAMGPVSTTGPATGYNANHAIYPSQRQLVQSMVSGARAEVIRVNASVQYLVDGRSKPKQLGTVFERILDVPAQLLPDQLKSHLFMELYRKIMLDTYNYPFQLSNFDLCGPGLSDLEKHPSKPAVYDQCFRVVTKQGKPSRVFIPNHMVDVFLVIKKQVWSSVHLHIQAKEEEYAIASEPGNVAQSVLPSQGPVEASTGPTGPAKMEPVEEPQPINPVTIAGQKHACPTTPTTARVQKRSTSKPADSPDENAIRRALQASDYSKVATASVKMSHGLFFPIPIVKWDDLVLSQHRLKINYELDGCLAVLRLDEHYKNMLGRPGTFKTAHPAYITLSELPVVWEALPFQPIPLSQATPVAGKRYFHRDQPGGPRMHTGPRQESAFMEGEANLLYWATSLHELSKTFVSRFLDANPSSVAAQLEHPNTRMVYGGLFQHGLQETRSGLVILVEELIMGPVLETDKNGRGRSFVKFVSNSSPVPRITEGEAGRVARYLSFFQHVQYIKTEGMAFVSDYQGSLTLLSDPQIVTHPDLGTIFGDGNVTTAFFEFEQQHPCNEYCRAFGLKPLHDTPGSAPSQVDLTESSGSLPTVDDVIKTILKQPVHHNAGQASTTVKSGQAVQHIETITPAAPDNTANTGHAVQPVAETSASPPKVHTITESQPRHSTRLQEKREAALKKKGRTETAKAN